MQTYQLPDLLRANPYPGRGIVLGRTAGGHAALAYFIMGRSGNSRNRVFVPTPDGIRTQAHDPSLMTDPSLIIYAPVRRFGRKIIVTNGDQTDTIREGLAAGKSFAQALSTRTFEPDAPNYTPRISGLLEEDGSYALSILKSAGGDPSCCRRYFFHYDAPLPGQAHFLHTYQSDGDPLPSFEGEPEQVALTAPTAAAWAEELWDALNEENKVSLFVQFLDLDSGKAETVLKNKHG